LILRSFRIDTTIFKAYSYAGITKQGYDGQLVLRKKKKKEEKNKIEQQQKKI